MRIEAKINLRDALGEGLLLLGEKHDDLAVVCADVMASTRISHFARKYPERTFNTGIAEQEMVSFAAGLSREGFVVYIGTFGPFISMRACEQVYTDLAYNQAKVRMLSIYSGVSGGISGATHWTVEDCAIMRGIPDMVILEPCDCRQLCYMMEETYDYPGPVYFRITIEPVMEIYREDIDYRLGKAIRLVDGKDGSFICSGITVKYALYAAQRIEKETGKTIRVVDMHTIKPIDEKEVIAAAATGRIIVAQDHNVVGGLGDAVASVIAKRNLNTQFDVVGTPDKFFPIGHAPYLYKEFGLDGTGLYNKMMTSLGYPARRSQ